MSALVVGWGIVEGQGRRTYTLRCKLTVLSSSVVPCTYTNKEFVPLAWERDVGKRSTPISKDKESRRFHKHHLHRPDHSDHHHANHKYHGRHDHSGAYNFDLCTICTCALASLGSSRLLMPQRTHFESASTYRWSTPSATTYTHIIPGGSVGRSSTTSSISSSGPRLSTRSGPPGFPGPSALHGRDNVHTLVAL